MADGSPPGVLVLGVGDVLRGDDGVGVEIARRLRDRPPPPGVSVRDRPGEMTTLLDAWDGFDGVVLVDAMRSGAAPGTVRRFDLAREPLPRQVAGTASSHAAGVGEALELARVLGRLPPRVVVYAVEGGCFVLGTGLSDAVAAAAPALADTVLDEGCRMVRRQASGGEGELPRTG